jgi:hypothetical protein
VARLDPSALNNPFISGINNLADIGIGHYPLRQCGTYAFNC